MRKFGPQRALIDIIKSENLMRIELLHDIVRGLKQTEAQKSELSLSLYLFFKHKHSRMMQKKHLPVLK